MQTTIPLKAEQRALSIRVFDVGHGDSIVVEFPCGKRIGIIDCHFHGASQRGAGAKEWNKEEPKLASYLRERINTDPCLEVSFVCLSHFHTDHYLGLAQAVRLLVEHKIRINEFWDPGVAQKTVELMAPYPHRRRDIQELEQLYEVIDELCEQGTLYEQLVKPQSSFRRISGVRIDVLAPDSRDWKAYFRFLGAADQRKHSHLYPESTDEHLICSALLLTYGEGRALLGGDVSCGGWDRILKYRKRRRQSPLRCNAAKASHHGSVSGNFLPPVGRNRRSLWQQLRIDGCTVAAISGGYRSGLPHQDTLEELHDKQISVFCTGSPELTAPIDPFDSLRLPSEVKELCCQESQPLVDTDVSYHGDIHLELEPGGKTEVTTEFTKAPL